MEIKVGDKFVLTNDNTLKGSWPKNKPGDIFTIIKVNHKIESYIYHVLTSHVSTKANPQYMIIDGYDRTDTFSTVFRPYIKDKLDLLLNMKQG